MTDSKALARIPEESSLSTGYSVDQLVARKEHTLRVVKTVMVEGQHYGRIPGCGTKPTLLKAGAELLAMTFALAPTFAVRRDDLDGGHREYEVLCTLTHIPTGSVVAQGVGSCSTMESRYRYRRSGSDRVENKDLADTYNTVLKIAKKRAQVDATLTAVGASDLMTQDLEDRDRGDPNAGEGRKTERQGKTEPNTEARQDPGEEWIIDMIGRLDEAKTAAELKKLRDAIMQMTPSGSKSRRLCSEAYEQARARFK